MRVLVAVPVHRVRCRIWTDDAREWSVLHEAMMLALARGTWTLHELASVSRLPQQIVVTATARLMRHRLVEVVVEAEAARFRASRAGQEMVDAGTPLPRFPNEKSGWLGLVIERHSGSCFRSREVKPVSRQELDARARNGQAVATVQLPEDDGSAFQITPERVADIVERGGDRRLLRIESSSVSFSDGQFMVVNVVDGVLRLPATAEDGLRDVVTRTARAAQGRDHVGLEAPRAPRAPRDEFPPVACDFGPADLAIGGSDQRALLCGLIAQAKRRVVVHSTFVDVEKFVLLRDEIRAACARGVTVDLLFGAEAEDPVAGRNVSSAQAIVELVSADPVMQNMVRMRIGTTGSHAKIVLADDGSGGWTAVVGSCNWLASPFQSTEASAVLRHPLAVADAMNVLQRIVGRRQLADGLANELAIEARRLKLAAGPAGGASAVRLVVGASHEALMRQASGEAVGELFFSTHRLGANFRTAALMPAEAAMARGVAVGALWHQPNKPMTRKEAREAAEDATRQGMDIANAGKIPIHGKVLLWTPDNVVVTSQNWASASTNDFFPAAEVGVHIRSPGLADRVLQRLGEIYPERRTKAANV